MEAPTLAEVIRDAISSRLDEVMTATVGRVVSYDSDTQTASVLPVMHRPFNLGSGLVDFEELPVIPDVPIMHPRVRGFYIYMPVSEGDHVLLIFTHDDIANWRQSGDSAEPDDLRRHSLGSCVGAIGMSDATSPLATFNMFEVAAREAGMVIGKEGGMALLQWKGEKIVAGLVDPTQGKRGSPVALADRTDARLQALEAQVSALTVALTALTTEVASMTAATATAVGVFASHVHICAAPASPCAATATPMAAPPGPPGSPPPVFVPVPLTTAADVLEASGPLP